MEWTEITLGDHIEVLTDYHANGAYEKLKANVTLKNEKDFAVMIRTLNFERGDFEKELIYINEKEYNFLSKSKVYPGDILMNKIADAGSVYCMPDLNCPVSLAMNLFLIRLKTSLNQRFMYYMMKFYEPYIKLYANGAATLTITKDSVRNLKFKVPNRDIQDKIVALISTYDDLIENNLKRIMLLEEAAQITFEEWFVRMKFPGYETTNLDEETGLPEGWGTEALGKLLKFQKGRKVEETSDSQLEGTQKLLLLKSLETGDYEYTSPQGHICAERNDILMLMDGARSSHCYRAEKGIVGSTMAKLAMNKRTKSYIYYFLTVYREWLVTANTGAAIPHANKSFINKIQIKMPSDKVLGSWNQFIVPLENLIWTLKDHTAHLKEARNILLPRLMTGMIDIEQVELPEAMLKRLEQQQEELATAQ
jgi:type I restriction enzyme S subunit